MRRYQFVKVQIYFGLMSLYTVNILEKLLCFSLWWLFHCQTTNSQDTVAITSWKNTPGFFVILVPLKKYYLKMLKSIIPPHTDCGNTPERDPNKLQYTVCVYLNVCNLCSIKKKKKQGSVVLTGHWIFVTFCWQISFCEEIPHRESHGRREMRFAKVQFCDLMIMRYRCYFNKTDLFLVPYSISRGGGCV